MNRPTVILFTILLALLVACGGPSAPVPPQALEVTPLSGPPGTPLMVSGLEPGEDAGTIEAYLGDQAAPVIVQEDGTLTTAIPLFTGESGWPAPPAEPQMLELRRGSTVIGRSTSGVQVTELEKAPGSTRAVQEALIEITAGYETLFALIPTTHPQEAPLRDAALAMLRELVSEGENSLQAVLSGSAPLLEGAEVELDLADALLASSGTLEVYQHYAEVLSATRIGLDTQALAGLCEEEGEDVELACKMQIHAVLKDFAEIVVSPTATTYAYWVGLPGSILGMSKVGAASPAKAPLLAAVSLTGALLSMADFVMNKLVPGLFPSELSQFELQVKDTTLEVGDLTDSTITVAAVNNPPPISVADLAEQLLTLVGLKSLDGIDELRKLYLEAAKFVVDAFYKALRTAEAAAPGTFPDLSADDIHVPIRTWGPVEVTNERLVTLFSYEPEVVAPLEEGEGLEWKAIELGEATVRVQTRGPGEKAKLLKDNALCLGCVYYGGAFGLDSKTSEATISVGEVFLSANPPNGKAPLTTTFIWEGLEPQDEPLTCTLDLGDGSLPYKIEDCAVTTTQAHTYAHTSRLQSATGAYEAVLSIDGTETTAKTEVVAGWTLSASPTSGSAPLDVTFNWSGFDPNGPTLTCSLEPGDGSPAKTIGDWDCASVTSVQHQYTQEGSYQATLFVKGGAFEDYSGVQITATGQGPPEYYTGWFTGEIVTPYGFTRWQGVATFERYPDSETQYRTTTPTTVHVQREHQPGECTYSYETTITVPPDDEEPIAKLSVFRSKGHYAGQISHWIVRDIPTTVTCSYGSRTTNSSFGSHYLWMSDTDDGLVDIAPDGTLTGSSIFNGSIHHTWSFVPGLEPPADPTLTPNSYGGKNE